MVLLYSRRLLTLRMVSLAQTKIVILYGRALELVKYQLRQIGLDPTKYGLHSLRSGGASLAAATGVPDWQIRCHGGGGGWRVEVRILREQIYQRGEKFTFGHVQSISILSPTSLSCVAF